MKVVENGGSAGVEEVLADAKVVGAITLPLGDVGQGVSNADAVSQDGLAFGGLLGWRSPVRRHQLGWMLTERPFELRVQRSSIEQV